MSLDSGLLSHSQRASGPEVVFSRRLELPGAAWLRLNLEGSVLPGVDGSGTEALVILSADDGSTQALNARRLREWSSTSAYFNGGSVTVQVVVYPGSEPARLSIPTVMAGEFGSGADDQDRVLCGILDDRLPSNDPRVARLMPASCTGWLINDPNKTFFSAGHCNIGSGTVAQFNVPPSLPNGTPVFPPPEHQYAVDPASVQRSQTGLGDDWSYFGCFTNPTTGLTAYQAQGQAFTLANAAAPTVGQILRITGYGTVAAPLPLSWNQAQKTGIGLYLSLSGFGVSYSLDTSGGNSGSPVILEPSGVAIGIHTSGGCSASGGANAGTAVQSTKLQAALAAPRGVCASGATGQPSGPLYAIGDAANNLGTINRINGQFARVSAPAAAPVGLAYRNQDDRFYAIDSVQRLIRIDPATGLGVTAATLSGASGIITDAVHEPDSDRLVGIVQATGQLHTIQISNGVCKKIGNAGGGTISGMCLVLPIGQLLGIDNAPAAQGGPRLVAINRQTGQQVAIGSLGSGLISCTGLVWCDDTSSLYTLDNATQQLIRVSRTTGAASPVGGTGAVWTSGGGMAYRRLERVCQGDANFDRFVDAADLVIVLVRWGSSSVPGGSGDVTGDGRVDLNDLGQVLVQYGCRPSDIPGPS